MQTQKTPKSSSSKVSLKDVTFIGTGRERALKGRESPKAVVLVESVSAVELENSRGPVISSDAVAEVVATQESEKPTADMAPLTRVQRLAFVAIYYALALSTVIVLKFALHGM